MKFVSYVLECDSVRMAFLCSPLHDLSDLELEILGDIDVLAIPCDDPKIFQKLIEDIDPRVLVPLRGDGSKFAEALKLCGAQAVAPVKEYKIKGALPAEGREVVVFEA